MGRMMTRRTKALSLAANLALGLFALAVGGGWFLNEYPSSSAPEQKTSNDIAPQEHLDAQVPLDLPFVDSEGSQVTLRKFFDGARPVVLTMNYSNCPMLCSLQLNGLFQGLSKLDWDLGGKYQMVTVSIDPDETTERAQRTKEKYLKIYGREGVAGGWHVLTGREQDIRAVADAVGFRYKFVPETKEFAHTAVTMICTPAGRVSRYLYTIDPAPQTLRMALVEAGEGKVGTTMEQVLLFCGHFDSSTGRYELTVTRIIQLCGLVTLVAVGGLLLVYWRREARRARRHADEIVDVGHDGPV
jgi:protein SCO1